MEHYKNLGGDSGIIAYEHGNDYIRIKFTSGAQYIYTYQSAGITKIEQMKKLALKGQGLNAYINMYAKKLYARKEW